MEMREKQESKGRGPEFGGLERNVLGGRTIVMSFPGGSGERYKHVRKV